MKKVVANQTDVVLINDCTPSKIYGMVSLSYGGDIRGVYKLHRVYGSRSNGDERYVWVSFNSTDSWYNSEWSSIKDAIESVVDTCDDTCDVFEFDTAKEFGEWMSGL